MGIAKVTIPILRPNNDDACTLLMNDILNYFEWLPHSSILKSLHLDKLEIKTIFATIYTCSFNMTKKRVANKTGCNFRKHQYFRKFPFFINGF